MVPIGKTLLVLCLGLAPMLSRGADLCPSSGNEAVTVRAVEPHLELVLADGRRLRLAGLDPALDTPADPDLGERTRERLAALVAGKALRFRVLSTAPDRWGRLPVFAFTTGPADEPGGLATAALGAGLGRYEAEPAAHDCREALLAAEAKARGARLGLWADPYYAVLAVDDRAAFAERAGTVILAEGRLIAVVSGPYRTKLRFAAPGRARSGGVTLAATILPRTMKTFKSAGIDVDAMIGRTIRLRGLLDLRFGPQIELNNPDEIADVTATSAAAGPAPLP